MMGSATMTELIEQASNTYDYVIIDAMPFQDSHDVASFTQPGGNVVLVAASGRTRKQDLKAAVDQLNILGSHVLGVVLDQSD